MSFSLENACQDFEQFWFKIGAEGDLSAALAEWKIPHNKASSPKFGSRLKFKVQQISKILLE